MTDTYTNRLRLVLQEPFTNTNVWGNLFNAGVTDLVEQAIAGVTDIDFTSGDVTLSTVNGAADEARSMFLFCGGSAGSGRNLIVPNLPKIYAVANDCGQTVTIKTSGGVGVAIEDGAITMVFVDTISGRVRALGRAAGIAPATRWQSLVLTVNNRTAGASTVTAKWSRQGHLVTFMMPAHTTTTSSGAWTFSGTLPDEIIPNASFPFTSGVQIPAHVTGLAAGAAAALSIGNTIAFANIGIASFGAGPYVLPRNLTVTYSTRRP